MCVKSSTSFFLVYFLSLFAPSTAGNMKTAEEINSGMWIKFLTALATKPSGKLYAEIWVGSKTGHKIGIYSTI